MLKAILIVQLVVPIVLGIPIFLWANISSTKRGRSSPREGGGRGSAKRLAPLQCPACSAPVPLQREPFACPSCRATVTPPYEYVRMLDLRADAIAALARAERRWRWLRWTSSLPLAFVLALASIAWFVLVVYAMVVTGWGRGVDIVLLMTAGFCSAAGIASAFGLVAAGKTLPPVPASRFMHPPAASATCKHCNAPVTFAIDQLAAICPYCGGDNYREALAQTAYIDASTRAQGATDSLVDAIAELEDRRDWLYSILGCAAAVEILYGLLAAYGACSDWLNRP